MKLEGIRVQEDAKEMSLPKEDGKTQIGKWPGNKQFSGMTKTSPGVAKMSLLNLNQT